MTETIFSEQMEYIKNNSQLMCRHLKSYVNVRMLREKKKDSQDKNHYSRRCTARDRRKNEMNSSWLKHFSRHFICHINNMLIYIKSMEKQQALYKYQPCA